MTSCFRMASGPSLLLPLLPLLVVAAAAAGPVAGEVGVRDSGRVTVVQAVASNVAVVGAQAAVRALFQPAHFAGLAAGALAIVVLMQADAGAQLVVCSALPQRVRMHVPGRQ